jgi:signal transduction histidine kinase
LDETGTLYLNRIKSSADRMCRLVDELLNLARLSRAEVRRERVDLSALAAAVVDELRLREPNRQVECTIQEKLFADGDPVLLRVLLTNLFENAWKFTSHHASANVEFGAERDGSLPVFHVRDDGAGFDMTRSDRLFKAFQRLHAQSEFEGTGVGLATVERIVRRHGGRIWAEGAVERGAVFYFTLQKRESE